MATKKSFWGLMSVLCVLVLVLTIFHTKTENVEAAEEVIYWAFEPREKKGSGTLHLGNKEYTDACYTEKGSFGIGQKFSDCSQEETDLDFIAPWISVNLGSKIKVVKIDDVIQPLTTEYWF